MPDDGIDLDASLSLQLFKDIADLYSQQLPVLFKDSALAFEERLNLLSWIVSPSGDFAG